MSDWKKIDDEEIMMGIIIQMNADEISEQRVENVLSHTADDVGISVHTLKQQIQEMTGLSNNEMYFNIHYNLVRNENQISVVSNSFLNWLEAANEEFE